MDGDKTIFAVLGGAALLMFIVIAAVDSSNSSVEPAREFDVVPSANSDGNLECPPDYIIDEMEAGACQPIAAGSGRIDETLTQQERENWAEDPNSFGWSDQEREFFDEHGISESEARSAETILREQGID